MMIIYEPSYGGDPNLWNKEVLIAVREFEKEVRELDDYSTICIATKDSTDDNIECDINAF